MKNYTSILYNYFKGLEMGNEALVVDAFAADAIVHSPLYGTMPANAFYAKLFGDTRQSDISVLNIFENSENSTAAVHFRYHWVLSDGTPTDFECVDVFRFNESGKIAEMTIIYDTHKLRSAFERLKL